MGTVIGWIIIGLIAGWLAGQIMGGGGFGVVGDIVVGLIGAIVGGLIAGLINPDWGLNGKDPISWGSLILAVIGAIILIAIVRAITGSRRV